MHFELSFKKCFFHFYGGDIIPPDLMNTNSLSMNERGLYIISLHYKQFRAPVEETESLINLFKKNFSILDSSNALNFLIDSSRNQFIFHSIKSNV